MARTENEPRPLSRRSSGNSLGLGHPEPRHLVQDVAAEPGFDPLPASVRAFISRPRTDL